MRSLRVCVAAALLLSAAAARGQEGSTKELRVETTADAIIVHCSTHVSGMKGQKVQFACELLQGDRPVNNGTKLVSATPSYDSTMWEDDSYELPRAPVFAALGPGRHDLVARVTITDPASGAVLGRDEVSFALTVPGAPQPPPRAPQVSAQVSELSVDPDAQGEKERLILVACKIEVNGLKGQPVHFVCQLHQDGNPIPGGLARVDTSPKFDAAVWKRQVFSLRRAWFEEKLGTTRRQLEAVVSVLDPQERVIGLARAPFMFGSDVRPQPAPPRPTSTPPASAPPPGRHVEDPTQADVRSMMPELVDRLVKHPQGIEGLAFDERLVGSWFSLTPFVSEPVLRDFIAARRPDLSGYQTIFELRLDADGTGELRELPLEIVLSGPRFGEWSPEPSRARAIPIASWGVEVHPYEGVPYCLLRLNMRGGFERGLYTAEPGDEKLPLFGYTYFNEQTQAYHDQPLLFYPRQDFDRLFGALATRTAPINQRLVRQAQGWRGVRRDIDGDAMRRLRTQLLSAQREAAMTTINDVR